MCCVLHSYCFLWNFSFVSCNFFLDSLGFRYFLVVLIPVLFGVLVRGCARGGLGLSFMVSWPCLGRGGAGENSSHHG